jgi:mono/diheme cytochrome c family protein
MSYLVASVAGVAFFVMSVVLLGVWPGRVLEEQTRAMSPEHPMGLSPSERRGRAIYSREGCAYCHTQQVRYVHADMVRFGAPTLAWETRFDYPHLWGTRRIGPDLAREGAVHTQDWHYVHLFAPRSVVPDSVMPSYASLFVGAPDAPTQDARDLVAYLDSLGRAREIAGPEGEARARAGCRCPDDEMAQMGFGGPLNAHPARMRPAGSPPVLPEAADLDRGRRLYVTSCGGCHGADGRGDGPGAAGLHPRPANLAEHEYTRTRLAAALWNGVNGTAMQAWRDQSPADLASIADVVRRFSAAQDEAPPAGDVLAFGSTVFAANCAQCHGVTGAGDGSAARELRMAPTDFRSQRASLAAILRVLRSGIEGTQMAPWTTRLREDEMMAVAYYVRSMYAPGGTETRTP